MRTRLFRASLDSFFHQRARSARKIRAFSVFQSERTFGRYYRWFSPLALAVLIIAAPQSADAQRSLKGSLSGIQLPQVADSDEHLQNYWMNLANYALGGANTVVFPIPVTDVDGNPTFSPDGKTLNKETKQRLKKAFDIIPFKSMYAVVRVFDDQPGAVLRDRKAYISAAKTVAKMVAKSDNLILQIAPPAPSVEWLNSIPYPMAKPGGLTALAKAIHEVDPKIRVAAGARGPRVIGKLIENPEIDIVITYSYATLDAAYKHGKAKKFKPVFDFSSCGGGGWAANRQGDTLQGVWRSTPNEITPEIKAFKAAIQYAKKNSAVHFMPSFPSWMDGTSRGRWYEDEFEVGGQGVPGDPGIRWYFDQLTASMLPIEEVQAVKDGYTLDGSWISKAERDQGFEPLYDQKTLTGWTMVGASEIPWRTDDKMLTGPEDTGTWIRSWRRFKDFNLRLEVKLTEGCNSGIFVRAPLAARQSRNGMECQLLGIHKTPDKNSAGSLYDGEPAMVDAFKDAGEWNEFDIIYVGRRIKITLNGTIIHDRDLTGHPILGNRTLEGYIGLQAHGHGSAQFRNVRILEI